MSTLIAGAVIAQLCYVADNDVGAKDFLRVASLLEQSLTILVEKKTSACLPLTSQAMLDEARRVVAADSTGNALHISEQ